MELFKPQAPLEFKFEDVTFLVKARAVDADRLEVWGSGEVDNGRIVSRRAEFVKALIRCFVLDWRGVTIDGKPAPYSVELFFKAFPSGEAGAPNVFLAISDFILSNTDIFKKDEAEKNASRAPSTGSAEPAPSTAPGRTAARPQGRTVPDAACPT